VIFIVIRLIIQVLASIFGLIRKLPLIKTTDRFLGAILGFVVGLVVINYGILKAIIVFAFAFIGYKLGDSSFTQGVKKTVLKRLKED